MLLIETNLDTRIKLEEKSSNNLTRFRGIFAKLDHKTENGRIYSEELWNKIIKSRTVQERLERKQMLGELKHPEYRDIDIEKSAFIITKLWIENGYVFGEAEVTPYPTLGGILEVFLKAGCQIGISSRGEGSIVERSGESYVDPKDFELITFDITLNPAVSEAQPVMVKESLNYGLEHLKRMCDISELKKVISITENSINKKIMSFPDDNRDKNKINIGKLVERLKRKTLQNILLSKKILTLEESNEKLNLKNSEAKSLNERLLNKSTQLLGNYETLLESNKNLKSFKESKSKQTTIFQNEFSFLKNKYEESLKLIESFLRERKTLEIKVKTLEKRLEFLKEKNESNKDSALILKEENLSLKDNLETLENKLENLKGSIVLKEKRLRDLEKLEKKKQAELKEFSEELIEKDANSENLKKRLNFLENKVKSSERIQKELLEKNENLESLLRESKKIIEKQKRIQTEKKTSSSPALLGNKLSSNSEKEKIKRAMLEENVTLDQRLSKTTSAENNSENEDSSVFAIMKKMY